MKLGAMSMAIGRYGGVAGPAGPFGGHATLGDDLVVYWPLDEESGQRNDAIGVNHLTDNNTVGFASVTPPPNFPAGKAASFAAATVESLSVADNATLEWGEDGQGATFAGWVLLTGAAGYGLLFGRAGTLANDRSFGVYSDSNSVANWWGDCATATDQRQAIWLGAGFAALGNGNWHFLVVRFDAATKKFSANLDNGAATFLSTAFNENAIQSPTAAVSFGSWTYGSLTMKASSFAFWNRAISDGEVADLYASGAGLFY